MVGSLARNFVGWYGAEELDKLSSPAVVGLGQGMSPAQPFFCKFAVVTSTLQVTRILPNLLNWSWRSTAKLPGYPCPLQGAWKEIIFDFPSNPNQSMVLSEGKRGFEGKNSRLAGGAAVAQGSWLGASSCRKLWGCDQHHIPVPGIVGKLCSDLAVGWNRLWAVRWGKLSPRASGFLCDHPKACPTSSSLC